MAESQDKPRRGVDKGSNMKDRIQIKVRKLNPVEIQKTTEKFPCRQSKTTKKEGLEHNDFVHFGSWNVLTSSRTPPDDILRWQDTLLDQI